MGLDFVVSQNANNNNNSSNKVKKRRKKKENYARRNKQTANSGFHSEFIPNTQYCTLTWELHWCGCHLICKTSIQTLAVKIDENHRLKHINGLCLSLFFSLLFFLECRDIGERKKETETVKRNGWKTIFDFSLWHPQFTWIIGLWKELKSTHFVLFCCISFLKKKIFFFFFSYCTKDIRSIEFLYKSHWFGIVSCSCSQAIQSLVDRSISLCVWPSSLL